LVEHAAASGDPAFEYEAAYLLPWKDHVVRELEAQAVPVHCLEVRSLADLRWLRRLVALVEHGHFDVVHLHSPAVAALARPALRLRHRGSHTAIVYTEHNRWPSHHSLTRLANRATYRLDDATLAVSADVKASVAPGLRSAVEVVRHGIDVNRVRASLPARAEVRAELGVGPGDVLAITIANLRPQKNYAGLLEAAKDALDRNQALQFVAVGQGPLEDEVNAQHAALGLGDRFRLLGYRPDATRLLAASDLFVLASVHEGLPVSVMEALALGVPVVATSVGGVGEAVSNETNGVLVNPGDPAAFADALVRVADDGVLRAELSCNARASSARFSARAAAARIEDVYRAVTDERS
jgi:glycosyltransferase involved in cell wall biosynthesis